MTSSSHHFASARLSAGPPGRRWRLVTARAVASGHGTARLAPLLLAAAVLALAPSCHWVVAPRPLVVAFGEETINLDPHRGNRNVAWSVLSAICDGLVSFADDMTLEPALAESWEQVDPTHWRFTLRRGVWFHGGAALTAADVVASIERARTHPLSAVSYHLVGVQAVRAEGDRGVAIETSVPVPDLLNRLTFVLVVPQDQARLDKIDAPSGTGSYRFIRKEADGTVVARAWAGWRGRPAIADVRFEFCGSDEEAARRLVAGAADVCHRVPEDWINEVSAATGVRLVQQPRLSVQLLGIHPEVADDPARRALTDPRVRRALLHALDRGAWLRRLFRGNGSVATQYVHPAVFGFDPDVDALPFDPDAARRLLAEAGHATGFAVTLAPGGARAEQVEAIVEDLGRIGVRVRVDAGATSGVLTYFAWACSTGDASDFLNSPVWRAHVSDHLPQGAPSSEPAALALAAAADREADPERRRTLLQQAQRLVLADMPLLPLTIRWGFRGIADRVEAVTRYDEREAVPSFRWRR